MKPIFRLYARDISGIVRNWAALITILGLICLPSLYAWFNIKGSWDPYGNTSGLAVAVASNDKGATIRGQALNAGAEIIESLHSNDKIGWVFTDEQQALKGVKHGDYYASIIIPDNFSSRIATVLNDKPIQAEIEYFVNEKINAVSPKIAASGASGIVQQIRSTFIKTANGAIFSLLNEVGVELEKEKPTIENTRNLVFKLEELFPDLQDAVRTASDDAGKAEQIVKKANEALPTAVSLANDGRQLAERVNGLLAESSQAFDRLAPSIKQDLELVNATAKSVADIAAGLKTSGIDPEQAKKALTALSTRLATAIRITSSAASLFGKLADLTGRSGLADARTKLNQISARLDDSRKAADQIVQAIDRGEEPAKELLDKLEEGASKASAVLDDLLGRFDSELKPQILKGLGKAQTAAQNANRLFQQAAADMPGIESLLRHASKGLGFGRDALTQIEKKMPVAKTKIDSLAARIRQLEKEGSLEEVIDLLRNNAQRESAFFAEPVLLKENRLYPIPNYGSAMSPFFSTMSIWVGALLLVSLLSTDPHLRDGDNFRSHHIYFGRFLTFLTASLLQSALITTGDIVLIGAYASDALSFVLFGLLLSFVFMLIVYTLVSVFGNVGKALAIVLLVLQLAASGGTFPIQVALPFFQAIHPFLPFTYAISLMREAVGGILWDVARMDMLALITFAAVALLIGLFLKAPINRLSAGFVRKAKESDLIH
ncbi:YhgE/Pip family protein [Paenibacillus sp. NPDC058071]|uniref:YhgE/Pip family protein n=1 Tax=Paenibacillus sp. NPDC058071 TaxID=3346326 RepID=UPI0036DCB6B0